jgi:pimeloyl-ACP methyl ester carboxylesterase
MVVWDRSGCGDRTTRYFPTVPLRLDWNCGGAGEPLLLLHGIGSTRDDFAALRPRLDADYRVLAPDLPGHGRSAPLDGCPTVTAITDAVEADLDELKAGRVHVLGKSIGARVALELARRRGARSVVAIAPSGPTAERAALPGCGAGCHPVDPARSARSSRPGPSWAGPHCSRGCARPPGGRAR